MPKQLCDSCRYAQAHGEPFGPPFCARPACLSNADLVGPTPALPQTTGVAIIAAERLRQISGEGWTPEHDAEHVKGEMAQAGACYAWPPPRPVMVKKAWPWDFRYWKPTIPAGGTESTDVEKRDARIHDLAKAGALIAAEIDRLSRTTAPQQEGEHQG